MATTAGVKLNRSVNITLMYLPYLLLNKLKVCALLVLILTFASSSHGENTYEDSTYEFLKREYSLSKPYQGKRLFLCALTLNRLLLSGTCFNKDD